MTARFTNPFFLEDVSPEIVASRVRQETLVYDNVPVDLETICNLLDIKIKYIDLVDSVGLAESDSDGSAVIYIQNGMGGGITRFTIAHELGHWVMHYKHEEVKRELHNDLNPFRKSLKNRFETEANAFASALLFPNAPFKADLRDIGQDLTITSIDGLANKYQASFEAAANRFMLKTSEIACHIVADQFQGDKLKIRYCMPSQQFKDEGLFIASGNVVPVSSFTMRMISGKPLASNDVPAQQWISKLNHPRQRVYEEPRVWERGASILLWVKDIIED